jgi:hypothetical protein
MIIAACKILFDSSDAGIQRSVSSKTCLGEATLAMAARDRACKSVEEMTIQDNAR